MRKRSLVLEIVATALFVMVILTVATDERAAWNGVMAPFLIGLYIFTAAKLRPSLAPPLPPDLLAVPKGQMEAARSLGMSHGQAMRRVIVPQAIRNLVTSRRIGGIQQITAAIAMEQAAGKDISTTRGISIQIVRRDDVQTSASVLPIRPSGERPAFHVVGANGSFGPDDVPPAEIEGATHLHLGGPEFLGGEAAGKLLAHARSLGATTSLDDVSKGKAL